jgi:hypothetical protein
VHLQIGQVFRLYCQTCAKPKVKFFVVALLQPLRCFVINSRATDFQEANAAAAATLAPIRLVEHAFLSWDSFVACDVLFSEYSEQTILDHYARTPAVYVGDLSLGARASVRAALQDNKLLPVLRVKALAGAWAEP